MKDKLIECPFCRETPKQIVDFYGAILYRCEVCKIELHPAKWNTLHEPKHETVEQWISVKDKLPKIGEIVLFYNFKKNVTQGYLDMDDDCSWWEDENTEEPRSLDYVTHWKPLPPPPLE